MDAILRNIHGEHRTRIQTIHQKVYDVTDESSEKDKQKTDKKSMKRSRPENVHTFPLDEAGNYLVPLGGSHGYLMGALRASIADLYKDKLKDANWAGYGILGAIDHGVIVSPEWVSVGKTLEHPVEEPRSHMVQTAGINKSMMAIYYDVVAKADIHLAIDFTNEKIPENIFLSLLAHTQLLGMGPKGRGSLKIMKLIKTKG
jgi:hypothetical protein